MQTIGDGLIHQRVIGYLAIADDVLAAGDLVREDVGEQILGLHALQLRRELSPAAEARQGERHGSVPAPAGGEHRRVEQRLHEQWADGI